ncbi:MAG: DUF2147 domain-containing protein [Bacteroidia bacterium]|nr:DUF2147 domain-containing protein [Bacteroidia bacterium]
MKGTNLFTLARICVLTLMVGLLPLGLSAQQADGCIGFWKTVDDETKEVKSVVQIYKSGNKYQGKVVKLYRLPGEDPNPICDLCDEDDSRYNKPVLGMVVLTDLEWDASDNEWDDGEILDPQNGSVYDCYITLEGKDKMKVRGFLGLSLLGRTQYWYRVEDPNK